MRYMTVSIRDYLVDENLLCGIFETFSCPKNKDIEDFLKEKSIDFEKKHFGRTYLVIDEHRNLAGYFTLALKAMNLDKSVSNRLRKLVSGYSNKPDSAIYLIGQLGKNYANPYVKQFSGDSLINIAVDYINEAQDIVGGRAILVECENRKLLMEFYERCGFQQLSKQTGDALLTYVISLDKLH